LLARETIYIHDWWLSPGEECNFAVVLASLTYGQPELQLRRPNKDKYRLDRLLERKAKEGVKVFIIV
jgi:phospholipase D1/2